MPAGVAGSESTWPTARQQGVAYEGTTAHRHQRLCALRPNGEILAVVEAKRTSVDPRLAEAQAEFYVTEIEKRQSFRPFAFMTNGHDIYFWDVGRANKRQVLGLLLAATTWRTCSTSARTRRRSRRCPSTPAITDRPYQMEAIRRVCEAFEQGKRKALLVMATGTGKTRVGHVAGRRLSAHQPGPAHPLCGRPRRAGAAGLDDGFKAHIPDEPCTRIYSHDIDTDQAPLRRHAADPQQLLPASSRPAFFDLIIFDEVHRSIFNKWNEVLQYFDARMIGLTATPAELHRPQHLSGLRVPRRDAHLPLPLRGGHRRRLPGRLRASTRPRPGSSAGASTAPT